LALVTEAGTFKRLRTIPGSCRSFCCLASSNFATFLGSWPS
jgi:hypothetical protein